MRHLRIALGVEHAEQQAHERNQQKIRHEARDQDAEAIALAAISLIVLNSVQEPADRAFATPPSTRVGD